MHFAIIACRILFFTKLQHCVTSGLCYIQKLFQHVFTGLFCQFLLISCLVWEDHSFAWKFIQNTPNFGKDDGVQSYQINRQAKCYRYKILHQAKKTPNDTLQNAAFRIKNCTVTCVICQIMLLQMLYQHHNWVERFTSVTWITWCSI